MGATVAARRWPRTRHLLVILVGMDVLAVPVGWLLAGREPLDLAHQPIE